MSTTVTLPSRAQARATMRAAVLSAPGQIEIRNGTPVPKPGPRQVRIRMETCGVCPWNLFPWEGKSWFSYPLEPGAPGHECTGYIDAIGDEVAGLEIGQRCTALCSFGYAESDIANEDCVVPLPDALEGMLFPGESLGCAMNIFQRAGIDEGDTVGIVGIGFLGALLVQLAAHAGARVIAVGRHPFALEFARRAGASETIRMMDHLQIIEAVEDVTDGKLCDITIETAGKHWPVDLAGEITGERGRLVIAGYHHDDLRHINMENWNIRGLDVINAHERDQRICIRGVRAAVKAIISGQLDPAPFCTHQFPLEELDVAMEMTQHSPEGFMKAIIQF